MPKLFDQTLRDRSDEHRDTVTRYEMTRTLVEFLAAVAFIIGSIFFFYESLMFAGTWLFLIGSILFGIRPAIRLVMEIRLVSIKAPDKIVPEALRGNDD